MLEEPAVSSAQMWAAAGVVGLVDLALAAVLTRRLHPPWSSRLSLGILVVGCVGFSALFTWAFRSYWSSCYGYALPGAFRALAPLIGAILGALGWLFWRLARGARRWAVPLFLLLGGLESTPGHLNAIYRYRLLDRCPLLHGVSPISALVFGLFEFALYWAVVLGVAGLISGQERRA
jgi:hypothetical protein